MTTETTDLRQRIASALEAADDHSCAYMDGTDHAALADAVLPLVAAEREAGRRDGLREAANDLAAVANPHTERGAGVRWAAARLRARADAEDGAR